RDVGLREPVDDLGERQLAARALAGIVLVLAVGHDDDRPASLDAVETIERETDAVVERRAAARLVLVHRVARPRAIRRDVSEPLRAVGEPEYAEGVFRPQRIDECVGGGL